MNYFYSNVKKWFTKYKDQIFVNTLAGINVVLITTIFTALIAIIPWSIFDYKNVVFDYLKSGLGFSVTIKIYQIILYIIFWIMLSRILQKNKNKDKRLKIIEASYYTDNLHSLDMTRELNNAIENDKLKIVLSNNIVGDPEKTKKKSGKIRYTINGKESLREFQEKDLIEIP